MKRASGFGRRSGMGCTALIGAAALLAGLSQPAAAQRTHSYTAELADRALRRGTVYTGEWRWFCRLSQCTLDTSLDSLDLWVCQELASNVGPIERFGRPGWQLTQMDLQRCNAFAATEAVNQPGIRIGGAGMPPVQIPLPGGSTGRDGGDEAGSAGPPPEPRIERIEYGAAGSGELYIRGEHLPGAEQGLQLIVTPVKRPHCLGRCEEQFQPYANALEQGVAGRWDSDLLSLELAAFGTEPYTLEQFFAQLVTMVESHQVVLRSADGESVVETVVPIGRFGELDVDVDRDGHRDRRFGGDDCDDDDATLTTRCP